MTCFNHSANLSIGHCRQCQKHLCEQCYEIVEHSVCCKEIICQQRMKEEWAILERSKEIYMIGQGTKKRLPIVFFLYCIMGFIFMGWGSYVIYHHEDWFIAPVILIGVVFTALGLYNIFRKDRLNY